MWEKIADWDRELFIYLNNLGVEDYDSFWIFVTQPESWIPLHVLFLILFLYTFKLKKGLLAVFGTLFTFGITIGFTDLVKNGVARLRPNNEPLLEELIRVLQEPTNFSFFSGHAATSFAVTTFVFLTLRNTYNWVVLFYVWPILFALSRIFVGVHYPGDVLVGAGVGTLIAVLLHKVYTLFAKKPFFQSSKLNSST